MNQFSNQENNTQTLHSLVGDQWFVDLVERFYEGVSSDPILRPMYPEDLTDSKNGSRSFYNSTGVGAVSMKDYVGIRNFVCVICLLQLERRKVKHGYCI